MGSAARAEQALPLGLEERAGGGETAVDGPSPFLAARWVYNQRIEELLGRIRYHRGKEFAYLGVIAILVISLVTLASQSSIRTMYVGVDAQGHVVQYGAVEDLPTPSEQVHTAALTTFLVSCRAIAPDPITQQRESDRPA